MLRSNVKKSGFRHDLAPIGGFAPALQKFGVVSPRRDAAKGIMAAWANMADQRAVRAAATFWRMACLSGSGSC